MIDLNEISVGTLNAFATEENEFFLPGEMYEVLVEDSQITILMKDADGWLRLSFVHGLLTFSGYAGEVSSDATLVSTATLDQETFDAFLAKESIQEEKTAQTLAEIMGEDFTGYDLGPCTPERVLSAWVQSVLSDISRPIRYSSLLKRVPSLKLTRAGGWAPFQAEGTLDGYPFYFRYRSGYASLKVGTPGVEDHVFAYPMYIAVREIGGMYDSNLSPEAFQENFIGMLGELKKAPILWEFEGIHASDGRHHKAGEPSKLSSWGDAAEDAWNNINLSGDDEDSGERLEFLKQFGLSDQTTTVDPRIFPETPPDFTVLS
jgi:hypothetical protein